MRRAVLIALVLAVFPLCAARAETAAIAGTVRDAAGHGIPGMTVILQNGAGATVAKVKTGANGAFAFSAVPQGSYVLAATEGSAIIGSAAVSIIGAKPVAKDILVGSGQAMNVIITKHFEDARNFLSPKTGTSAYKVDRKAIAALPEGEDTPLDKVMLQMPGVAEDSAASGLLHIRGEHANVQYRLNGIILPVGVLGLGDVLDTHIIQSATLLDGVLPAQYGWHTAGIMDITTKTGFEDSGTASVMGGSNGTLEESLDYGGRAGNANYFVSASHLSSDLGIENPTSSAHAIHDHTEQNKEFGYADYMINPFQRVQITGGSAISYFQIPNNPNQAPQYTITGTPTPNSANLNERQFESNQFMSAAWQGGADGVEVQVAPYIRSSETHFRPDVIGDLAYNGIASDVQYNDLAIGLQNDNSWRIDSEHTLRAGFMVQNDNVQSNTTSYALLDPGDDTVSSPIVNDHSKTGQLYGLYLQDEWKLTDKLTVNYGARFDDMEQYVSANQLSPRVGFVYKMTPTTTLHWGYARTFTPPPMELISGADIAGFSGTTGAPAVTEDSAVKPERANDYDVGVIQKVGSHWVFGDDAYYKQVRDLLDEGQFGAALILTPFNYERGTIYGDEITATYTGEKLKAYGNFAYSRAVGENIISAQFNFDPGELAYISDHYVHLDHDQTYTMSGGISYDILKDTSLGLDSHAGSGLRDGFANEDHLPFYATLDASVEQRLNLLPHDQTTLRLSVINVFDTPYELRDGTGIGVGAPQWGARRGVFITVAQKF
ncbi:MAG TPA: TonB-dependent receptor [Alphaproteobacteria bacterium]|nr:TonB-dependent receptor [Alphaproteobacteria bacterium]